MCVIVVKPQGVAIRTEVLKAAWDNNADGAGFAYTENGKVVVEKGFMRWEDFEQAWDVFQAKPVSRTSNVLIHFRIRSQGAISPENTHPFPVKGGVMAHNGGFSGFTTYRDGKSDTAAMVEEFGKHLSVKNTKRLNAEIAKAVGFNKLAFLYNNGEVVIVNEDKGEQFEGCWFSNTHWKYKLLGSTARSTARSYGELGEDDWENYHGYPRHSRYQGD